MNISEINFVHAFAENVQWYIITPDKSIKHLITKLTAVSFLNA